MDTANLMRQAAGLPVETPMQTADRVAAEQREEKKQFDAELKACCRRHNLACSLSDEIESQLTRLKLGPAEQGVVDEMLQGLIKATTAVAVQNPNSGRGAYQTAVQQHIAEWIKSNSVIGGVLENSTGMIDRMVQGVCDTVMQAVEAVAGPKTATDSGIGKTMERAAGVDPTTKP